MATIDDILKNNGNSTTKNPVQPAKQQAPVVQQPATQQQPAASQTAAQPVAQQPTAQPATQQPVAQPAQPAMAQEPAATSVTQPSAVTQPATAQPEAAKPAAKSDHPLTDIIKALYPQPTPEEEAAEAKRKKREEVFASISDGLSALANLYFTTKGAPNAYNPAYSQSARVKARWDNLEANRAANRKAYIADYIRAQQADAEAADRERQYELEKAKAEAEQKLAEAKENRDAAIHDLNLKLKNNLIDKSKYDKKIAEEKAKFEGEKQRLELEAKKSAIALTKARMNHINSSGSGGSSGNRYYGEFQGKKYKTKADYEKAVLGAASDAGVDIYDTEVTERNYKGKPRKQRRVRRSIAAIAAELGKKTKKTKKFNVNDYRRGGRKKSSKPPLN